MKEIKILGTNEKVYKHVCSNGFTIYIWPYNLTEDISLSLTVKYGSIHTKFKIGSKKYDVPNGIAHFMEHIKFNEEKGITAHDFYNTTGAYTNAYTTFTHTSYEVICNSLFNENLEHLLYFVFNPYFTKGIISKEKGIIISESNGVFDNPYNVAYHKLLNNLYYNNHKKYLITGNKDEIKNIDIDDIKLIFDNFYVPNNMFLTVTGNVSIYDVINTVEEFFEINNIKNKIIPKIIKEKESNEVVNKYEKMEANVGKDKVFYAVKIPKKNFKNDNDFDLKVLGNIVLNANFGNTSEFNDEITNNELVDDFYYFNEIEDNHITFVFEATTNNSDEFINKINDKIHNLNLTKEEFERKKKFIIASSILGYEDANMVNSDIVNDIINYDKIINDFNPYAKKLEIKKALNYIKEVRDYHESVLLLKAKKN